MQLSTLTTLLATAGLISAAAIETRENRQANVWCSRKHHTKVSDTDDVIIYGKGWGLDSSGQKLTSQAWDQLRGCGAEKYVLTRYDINNFESVQDNGLGDYAGTTFNTEFKLTFDVPLRWKHNCLGRAIASAGGPPVKCETREAD